MVCENWLGDTVSEMSWEDDTGSDFPTGRESVGSVDSWGFFAAPESPSGDGQLASEEEGTGSGLGSKPFSVGALG